MIATTPTAPTLPSAPVVTAGCTHLWTRRDTVIVSVLMALMLVRGILVGAVVWPWYAPDEPDHVELALLTAAHGPQVSRVMLNLPMRFAIATSQYEWHVTERPPRPDDILPGAWAGQVGRQPPLYYMLAGSLSRLAPADDIVGQVGAMRLLSALVGAVIVGGAYLAGRLLAPDQPVIALGVAGVVVFRDGHRPARWRGHE